MLIPTLVRPTSNPTNSLVFCGCAIFQIVVVTVIRLEVENRLKGHDFYCIINIRWTRTIVNDCN